MQDIVINSFLDGIKEEKNKIESIYFFGSRARGTARPDSDYDLLIVVPNKNKELKDKLYTAAVDVYLKYGMDISLKIFKKDDFIRLSSPPTPFIENVLKEGIKIGKE